MQTYLLSSSFDYARSISPAAGPVYAQRMGWKTASFADLESLDVSRLIVDNRLTEAECAALPEIMARRPEVTFILKVIDPYYEWCQGNPYYAMLFEVKDEPNVLFLTPYVPDELVRDLDKASGGRKMVVVPYAYPSDHEQPAGGDRFSRVIFSGNQHRHVYPYRTAFGRLNAWWSPVRSDIDVLEHPGYPDIGEIQKHDRIGAQYVAHLARYAMMFVSPSRCLLEFLKYGECAAAGCLPVGQLPRGLPSDLAEPFVSLDFDTTWHLMRSARRAIQMPSDEIEARAAAYRAAARTHRDPAVLNATLAAFLDAQPTAA